jgi:hypothetical protein
MMDSAGTCGANEACSWSRIRLERRVSEEVKPKRLNAQTRTGGRSPNERSRDRRFVRRPVVSAVRERWATFSFGLTMLTRPAPSTSGRAGSGRSLSRWLGWPRP